MIMGTTPKWTAAPPLIRASAQPGGERFPSGLMKRRLKLFSVLLVCGVFGNSSLPTAMYDQHGTRPSDDISAWLLKEARARLSGMRLEGVKRPAQALAQKKTTLFVTAFPAGKQLQPRPVIGKGKSLADALEDALASVSGFGLKGADASGIERIQIDVLDEEALPLNKKDIFEGLTATKLIDPGREGILIEDTDSSIWLLPTEFFWGRLFAEEADNQKASDLLDRAGAYLRMSPDFWRSPAVKLSRFHTRTIVEDSLKTGALRLVRGAIPVDVITKARLNASARAGGDYLVRMQKQDGSFVYSYDAGTDGLTEREYNIVRHAGTAFSLFQLYESTHEPRYLSSANRAIAFLRGWFRPASENSGVYVLDNDGKAKLGAAGLSLLALTRQLVLDPKSGDRAHSEQLARFLLSMQRKDGSFQSYFALRGDEPVDSISLYYPGEAILGLVSLYKITADRRLLDSARRGANYLIESQRKMKELPEDAWLMQALEALHGIGGEKLYADHALSIAEAMMADQYRSDGPPGYAGGFGPGVPRSTPAASRAEGMLAAYRLARKVKDSRSQTIAESLRAAARFQLSQQFDRDNSFFLPNPGRAAGGFKAGVTSLRIRIDFVQHNICSLLGLAETG
jgi:hypothetical protein